jgi:phenylacetate-coenzyme A ligase PaaK-like adenylate-forming protein
MLRFKAYKARFSTEANTEEQFPTLAQMELFDFNTLVLPESATRGRGIGITDFHVSQGCVYVEVVNDNGRPVAHGESGRVDVTRLSGTDERGERLPNTGTQIFRLAIGDSATWITDPCPCGLTTPHMRAVQRQMK